MSHWTNRYQPNLNGVDSLHQATGVFQPAGRFFYLSPTVEFRRFFKRDSVDLALDDKLFPKNAFERPIFSTLTLAD